MTAVEVKNGFKYYGSSSDQKVILNYINVHVMRGSIYGLLGASGCGKTTLLSCIVGYKKLNSGTVSVLGTHPGSELLPKKVGYMPQEIALVGEMTIKQMIYFFGRIYGLADEKIDEKIIILRDLLELPPVDRIISTCSGGQQRRVSFACAMVHDPELLILDEPTVGLDPVLREKIWDFLVDTTKSQKMAVIITTHYIEEARQANRVGLMRNGILLGEDSPENIMEMFNCTTLEDAFLQLCTKQGDLDKEDTIQTTGNFTTQMMSNIEQDSQFNNPYKDSEKISIKESSKRKKLIDKLKFTTKTRMKALLTKNFIQFIRQPAGLLFIFLFPILQIASFYLAIGGNPENLKMGIVNEEVPNWMETCYNSSLKTFTVGPEGECSWSHLSCRFIKTLDPKIINKVQFNSIEDAEREAYKTSIIGFMHFSSNFTDAFEEVTELQTSASDGSINARDIQIRLDMSNRQIGYFLERQIYDWFNVFIDQLMVDCKYPLKLGRAPILFNDPIYGTFNDEFRDYMAPGVIVTMIFFLSTLVTAAVFISDHADGVWDRSLVSGVNKFEMLVAHIITQSSIMCIQSVEAVLFIAIFFNVTSHGSTILVVIIIVLLGFAGMLFGLLISIYCNSHTMANFVATGAFYPMIILCGLLWPLEGMPNYLRKFALTFPFTIPARSMRNILTRGWGFTNSEVYNGFLVSIAWILIFFFVSVLGLKRQK